MPWIVTVKVPVDVELVVVMVSVEFPEFTTEAGLKLAVALLGSPLVFRLTVPAKPFCAPMVTVYVVLLPCVTVCELGVAVIEKSGVVA